jgi:AraC family transcriptional regulator
MKTQRAEQNYRARVARVVAAIVADPMAEHRLEDLARLAHFSPFHFHRIYSSIAGETVATTVRRVRLALATRLLTQGDQSITQVGLAVGYESPQAFTRAFGQFTGQSPREFQLQMREAILDTGPALLRRGSDAPPPVRIVERPAQPVHALRHRGPFSTIPHTHRRLRAHAGTRINAAVRALYAQWLPDSGYEPDDRPTLEHYLNSPRKVAPAALRTDLLIPIRPADG